MQEDRKNRASFRAALLIDNCSSEDYSQLNVNWVANKVEVHPSYLSRVFQEDFNCFLKVYIERAKMDKGEELLSSGMLVKEVSCYLDYSNPSYFGSVFRKHKGVTPSSCRGNGK